MLKKAILILSMLISVFILAQENYVISQQGFIRFRGIHQGYRSDRDSLNTINEFSLPIEIYWPISRQSSLFVYTSHGSVNGDKLSSLSGLSDTQISWNYYLEDQNLVLNAGLSLPTGKATLTSEEFNTSLLLSQHYWNFITPSFGQGFNLSPGVTWALPLSDAAVMGLGLAYQIRGGFIPRDDLEDVYKPGNELLVTGGVDLRIATLSTVTWDMIFSIYESDTYADTLEVYKSGNKFVTSLQYHTYFGHDQLTLLMRYRSKSKNQYNTGTVLMTESSKTYPNQIELQGLYRHRHSPEFFMTYGLEGRVFEELDVYAGLNLIGLTGTAEYKMAEKTLLFAQFKLFTGKYSTDVSLSGIEFGGGFTYLF